MEELGNNKIYLRFRAKHITSSGPEVYNVNIPPAWVFPWESYWDSRKRLKGDKQVILGKIFPALNCSSRVAEKIDKKMSQPWVFVTMYCNLPLCELLKYNY